MCTMITQKVGIMGSGKGNSGWFNVEQANVSYDHPFNAPLDHALNIDFNAPLDHALNIDFVNEAMGPGARVAVELSEDSARALVETIQAVLDRAESGGHLESQMGSH